LLNVRIEFFFHSYGVFTMKYCTRLIHSKLLQLWAGRDPYRATPAVMQDPGLSGLIQMTAPLVASYNNHEGLRTYSSLDPHGKNVWIEIETKL
jgi:hypothetical protein